MSHSEWVGSIGVALLLLAFFANAFGYVPHASRRYHGTNAVGAALACLASFQIGFVPFVVLEGIWCVVAVVALLRLGRPDASGARFA